MWGLWRREWVGEWLDFKGFKSSQRAVAFFCGLRGFFVKLEPPEGTGVGEEGEDAEGPGTLLFPAVSASQVCERQCMCVFERMTRIQSMTHCIVIVYCGDKAGAQR